MYIVPNVQRDLHIIKHTPLVYKHNSVAVPTHCCRRQFLVLSFQVTIYVLICTNATGELNDLYCSHNIFRMIKSIPMRWAGRVARMGDRRGVFKV